MKLITTKTILNGYLAIFTAFVVLFAAVLPAFACMDGMMRAMTFMKHPQAKVVFEAAGRSDRIKLPATGNQQAHILSLMLTKRIVTHAQLRNKMVGTDSDDKLNISVLLAEEAFSTTLSDNSEEPEIAGGHTGIDLFSTASAFKSMLDGKLLWEDALAEKLVVLAGPDHRKRAVADRMRRVFRPIEH